MLPSYASNSIFVEKTLFALFMKVFLSFQGRFQEKLSQKCLFAQLCILAETMAPRLARLLMSLLPLKHLVLKSPIKPYEGTLLMIGMLHPISSVFRLIWIPG